MKTIDVIRPSSINAINGPIGTLKRLLGNRDYFTQRGYDITLFTNESINHGGFKNAPTTARAKEVIKRKTFRQQIRHRISSIIRELAQKYSWAAIIIDKKDFKKSKVLVDYYLGLSRSSDVIQFHTWIECYYYLNKRANTHAKTILFFHTDGIPFKMELESLPALQGTSYLEKRKKEFEWTIKHTDRLVFIAKIGQKNFLSYYPFRSEKDTSVIINGIDDLSEKQLNEVSEAKDNDENKYKYRLCCTGTISFRKGQKIIIETLKMIPAELLRDIHVDFIGEGAERITLEKYVIDNGLKDNVCFLGSIPNNDVYKYLAKNNIYVLMSKNEGLPISIIEAMRVGLPIISTHVSGIPELVNEGENGYLLNPDSKELANLMKQFPQIDWKALGKNSRSRFEKEFTFKRMRREFGDMYDLLM